MQNRRHGNVCFAGTRGSTDQQVCIAVEGSLVDLALDAVQGPGAETADDRAQSNLDFSVRPHASRWPHCARMYGKAKGSQCKIKYLNSLGNLFEHNQRRTNLFIF